MGAENELRPNFAELGAARERLRGQAHVTPVLSSRTLNRLANAEIFLKCENLQRGGAFKFRGAFNAISQLSAESRSRGVITYSSGNHAQAVALVCQLLGIPATIVMPKDAPAIKRAATEGYGARVIAYDPAVASREKVAAEIQNREGQTLVPPFDHPAVIAGQGTAALELFEQTGALDYLLIPCGGAGLLSGCAIAAKNVQPRCQVIGVEPELGDDATRSFRTKQLQTVQNSRTIADGTRTTSLGRFTFPLVLQFVDEMVTVSEEAIVEAVRFLFSRMKLVVEPSGALPVAALVSGAVRPKGRVGLILSGGNLDETTAALILAGQ